MDEIKLAAASNIIKLRTGAGMTQLELGEKLNYSDKTVSKWERGESLPDVYVLSRIAQLFGVTVDYLITEHGDWESEETRRKREDTVSFSSTAVTLVSLVGIWTLALLIFVIMWVLGHVEWLVFAAAVPISLITLLVFNSVWRRGKRNIVIVSALVLSVIALIYFSILRVGRVNPWQLFLVLIPAELVVFLSFKIRKR